MAVFYVFRGGTLCFLPVNPTFLLWKTYVSQCGNVKNQRKIGIYGLAFFPIGGQAEDSLSLEYPFRMINCVVYPMYLLHLLRKIIKIIYV